MSKFRFAVSGVFLDLLTATKGVADNLNINTAEFDFRSSEWDGAVKWAHFRSPDYSDNEVFHYQLIDDQIAGEGGLNLPAGMWEVWVHGEIITNEEVIRRITTDTQIIQIVVSNIENGAPLSDIAPSAAEQIDAKAQSALNARITSATADIDGAYGTPSADVNIGGENGTKQLQFHFHNLQGPTGAKGDTGDSGVHVGTSAPTDPGKNVWINPLGSVGKVIVSETHSGTHAPGTYDTYQFEYSDGTSLEFQVYNGADGSGIGDMVKSAYDPQNKAQDIFAYADGVKDKTSVTGLLKGSSGSVVQAVAGTDYQAPLVAGTDYQTPLVAGTDYQTPLTFDNAPTAGSNNPVKSGGIKTALDAKANASSLAAVATSGNYNDLSNKPVIPSGVVVDQSLNANSANPVRNSAVYAALQGKQNTLTIEQNLDSTSTNPISSKAVATAIGNITTRPNPYSLNIKVNGVDNLYNGSSQKTVTINTSTGGGDQVSTVMYELTLAQIPSGSSIEGMISVARTGYTPLGVIGWFCASQYVGTVFDRFYVDSNGYFKYRATHCFGSGTMPTQTLYIYVLYKKN